MRRPTQSAGSTIACSGIVGIDLRDLGYPPEDVIPSDESAIRSLTIAPNGNLYGATSGRRSHPPKVPGREVYTRIDCWADTTVAVLYGGTSDGYLLRFDTQKLQIENPGKPLNQYRLRGLPMARNGKLYGVGGDDDETARLFYYDPARASYEMLGMVDVNHRPYYAWQAYVIDAVALGRDGTLYMGQRERKSKLYLYYPE